MATKSIITSVEGRVEQLIADHRRLSELCSSLKGERDLLLHDKRSLQLAVKDLEHKLSVSQLCEGFASSSTTAGEAESRRRARARVNNLMREVDKCINLLSATDEREEGVEGVESVESVESTESLEKE